MGIYIQYIINCLVLIFDPKGGGGDVGVIFFRKTIISHFVFSSRVMLFVTFLEKTNC